MARDDGRPLALRVFAAIAALMLSGCALLTAEAPLFTAADQPAAAPFAPGHWVLRADACRDDPAYGPKACDRFTLVPAADGAWKVRPLGKDEDAGGLRATFVALEAPRRYLAETRDADGDLNYLAVVALGEDQPARRAALAIVACDAALAAGPIPDLAVTVKNGAVRDCRAETPASAREAVGRIARDLAAGAPDVEAVWIPPPP